MATPEKQPATVRLTTLGKFEISYQGISVTDDINRSDYIWELLAYISIHSHRDLSHSELIDLLWPDDESLNPQSALKTLVHRSRKTLRDHFGTDTDLIVAQRGSYTWNKNYLCETDIEQFEEHCRLARGAANRDSALQHYASAMKLYKGDLLPRLATKTWVIPLAHHYQSLYLEAVKSYAELLLEAKECTEALAVLNKALTVNPYDEEIHRLVIVAYKEQGDVGTALAHYEMATDLLYRHLSVQPSAPLRDLYRQLMETRGHLETDLGLIKSSLNEKGQAASAFVVDYAFFKEAYRLEARQAQRNGSCVQVALLTLRNKKDHPTDLDRLNKCMDNLLIVLKSSLRKGDVVSRYSGAQYIILLPTARYEDGEMVMGRIAAAYCKDFPSNDFDIQYTLQQVDGSA